MRRMPPCRPAAAPWSPRADTWNLGLRRSTGFAPVSAWAIARPPRCAFPRSSTCWRELEGDALPIFSREPLAEQLRDAGGPGPAARRRPAGGRASRRVLWDDRDGARGERLRRVFSRPRLRRSAHRAQDATAREISLRDRVHRGSRRPVYLAVERAGPAGQFFAPDGARRLSVDDRSSLILP